ncbi:unnamed protein product, partial [Ectocarpus sp. 8 AP-2014]
GWGYYRRGPSRGTRRDQPQCRRGRPCRGGSPPAWCAVSPAPGSSRRGPTRPTPTTPSICRHQLLLPLKRRERRRKAVSETFNTGQSKRGRDENACMKDGNQNRQPLEGIVVHVRYYCPKAVATESGCGYGGKALDSGL